MVRFPTPMLEECIKTIQQRGMNRERIFLRALLEMYQDMPLEIFTKESNNIESYRRLDEVRRYSNSELKVNRELIERAEIKKST